MREGPRLPAAGVVGVPEADGRGESAGDPRDARLVGRRARGARARAPGRGGPRGAAALPRLPPRRWRASPPRDHACARDLAAIPPAGRAVHRHRSHRDRPHPGDRRPASRARDRHSHHGPQRARDPRHHRPCLHPLRRQDPGRRHRDRDRQQLGRPRDLPRRPLRALAGGQRTLMAMEARLSLRQSQRVVMTPLLQQAIQLLQLSTLELQEDVVRTQVSLADHLEEQLRFVAEDAAVRRIGAEIIGNLDEDGYLRAELEEIAQRCNATAEEVTRVLELVQGFDPPGVAARSIQECLLLQLKRDPLPDPVSVEIIEAYFDDLSRRRYQDIARAMKLPVDRIMESVEEIMRLEPKPGRRFGGNDSRYIVPDVFVYKLGNDYTIVLNEDGIPRLRVNSLYRSLLRGAGSGDEAKQYVEQKLRSALWLIKSVDQRQRTLRKVTQSIVKFQREFLDRGLPHLRPLSLRDVGEDIGMHESTISRVTTNKYVETPQGLFELKFFFHSGIASGDGEMVSSVSVKKMIQDLLAAEDPAKPQSDQEVAQALQKRGLTIARRTVAKYREELGILPSHQRRLAPRKR